MGQSTRELDPEFQFLDAYPDLRAHFLEIQDLAGGYPAAAVRAARVFAEGLLIQVAREHGSARQKGAKGYEETFSELITRMKTEGIITLSLVKKIIAVKKPGDQASHGTVVDALTARRCANDSKELARSFRALLRASSTSSTDAGSARPETLTTFHATQSHAYRNDEQHERRLYEQQATFDGGVSASGSATDSTSPLRTSTSARAGQHSATGALATIVVAACLALGVGYLLLNRDVSNGALAPNVDPSQLPGAQIFQLDRQTVRDIWTTSVYSYAPRGGGPGGGLHNDRLRVGGWADEYWSLIRINLEQISSAPKSAKLAYLQLYSNPTDAAPTAINVGAIEQDWTWDPGDRLWWSNRPTTFSALWSVNPPVQGAWFAIDITEVYNQWQTGSRTNYGIVLMPQQNNNNFDEFSSSGAANADLRPRLVVIPN